MKKNSEGPSKAKRKTQTLESKYRSNNKKILETIINCDSKALEDKPSGFEIKIRPQYLFSQKTLFGYITLCWPHRENIHTIMDSIIAYANDTRRKRPLNIILQANPGSGKSHLIKCIATSLFNYNIREVTFNMATLQNLNDLIQPLDVVRNLKVNDQLPLLFLDEFDTHDKFIPPLLPLLWDGELQVANQNLKVGKVIIVIAGSRDKIKDDIDNAKKMQEVIKTEVQKLPDLLSRINGGELVIPRLDEDYEHYNRKVDKVCIAISLLEKRFNHDLERIPWALLHFIANCKFRFGARSIAHLIDLIPSDSFQNNKINLDILNLQLNNIKSLEQSSLIYHIISDEGPSAIVKFWKQLKRIKIMVSISKRRKPEPKDPFKYSKSPFDKPHYGHPVWSHMNFL